MQKNKITFIQDLFVSDHSWGGAEIADDAVIQGLRLRGKTVECIHSKDVTADFLKKSDSFVVVSNFTGLSEDAKYALMSKKYLIYEHDSKWNKQRNISAYPDYKVPAEQIINFNFYESAVKVILQSKRHLELTYKNLGLSNLISAGGNPWSEDDLKLLESLQGVEKTREYAILEHPYPQKNFYGAIEFALKNKFDFGVIYQQDHTSFVKELAQYKNLIFLPGVFETWSRCTCEAKALNLNILGNSNISFLHEDCSSLSGIDLINHMRTNNEYILNLFD